MVGSDHRFQIGVRVFPHVNYVMLQITGKKETCVSYIIIGMNSGSITTIEYFIHITQICQKGIFHYWINGFPMHAAFFFSFLFLEGRGGNMFSRTG